MPASALEALKKEHAEVQEQLKTFRELREQEARLSAAIDALEGRTHRSVAPRGSGGRGRKAGEKPAKQRLVELLGERPRIRSGEAATELGVAPAYMSKLVSELVEEGTVSKDGREISLAAS